MIDFLPHFLLNYFVISNQIIDRGHNFSRSHNFYVEIVCLRSKTSYLPRYFLTRSESVFFLAKVSPKENFSAFDSLIFKIPPKKY